MTICQMWRVSHPNTNRKVSQPKINPEAPMWLVGSRQLPRPPISQVPRPPRIQMIAVAQTNRDIPASVTRNPSTSAGTVFATRWPQLACSSGEKTTPHSPSVCSGRMPLRSSECPVS